MNNPMRARISKRAQSLLEYLILLSVLTVAFLFFAFGGDNPLTVDPYSGQDKIHRVLTGTLGSIFDESVKLRHWTEEDLTHLPGD